MMDGNRGTCRRFNAYCAKYRMKKRKVRKGERNKYFKGECN